MVTDSFRQVAVLYLHVAPVSSLCSKCLQMLSCKAIQSDDG